jgi:hypothetical protein
MLQTLKGKYKEYMAQYNTQGTGTLDGTAKFIVAGYQKNNIWHNTTHRALAP